MTTNTQTKNKIKVKFQNGLNFEQFNKEVFEIEELNQIFDFEESKNPDFVIFGPYGNDIPPKSDNYIRIGYFCENIKPDLKICEWAFGIPREEEVKHPNYKRIQWHGLNPNSLIKKLSENDIDFIVNQKTKFCNFLYSSNIPYREDFFNKLSKYKRIDAPGKSMNNMPSIDSLFEGDHWGCKRKFLSKYKFTIAFENYSYPGYQTEKLYDAMREYSIPIYCGDPFIMDIFNTKSFLNTPEYVHIKNNYFINLLENISQLDFIDIRPNFYASIPNKIKRKLKFYGKNLKMKMQYDKLNFSKLIDQIVEIDKNIDLYVKYLKEPWFNNNIPPASLLNKSRWIDIFNSK